jgi:predicted transcriptional regulator
VVNTLTVEVQSDVALNSELKIAIWQAKLSNKELAKRVGISAPNMSNIVNGATPHLKTAQKIVRALNSTGKVNVTIDELWPLED